MYVKLYVCKRSHDTGENSSVGQRLKLTTKKNLLKTNLPLVPERWSVVCLYVVNFDILDSGVTDTLRSRMSLSVIRPLSPLFLYIFLLYYILYSIKKTRCSAIGFSPVLRVCIQHTSSHTHDTQTRNNILCITKLNRTRYTLRGSRLPSHR
ncbi:hypothetical protein SFRURICE_019485 [Spodoptera frugiperda]|nr:hypothetical protein SFRURICE_019485 [Spodoptera frugiperda]